MLRIALVLGGMISAFGMFNALVMSYSRLPLAMAQDGMLPKFFGKLHPKTRAPWVAIRCVRHRLGLLPGTRIRAAGDDRHPAIRREPGAGVRGAGCVARARAEVGAAHSAFLAGCLGRLQSASLPC